MKKYKQQENKPLQVCEPVAAYQKQDTNVYQIPEHELASVMRANVANTWKGTRVAFEKCTTR